MGCGWWQTASYTSIIPYYTSKSREDASVSSTFRTIFPDWRSNMTIHFHYEILNHLLDWLEKCELDREPVLNESHHQKPTKNNQDQLQFTSFSAKRAATSKRKDADHSLVGAFNPLKIGFWGTEILLSTKHSFKLLETSTGSLKPWHAMILVGGWPTPLKNLKVKWDYCSQYMESHKSPWFQTTNVYHHGKTCKMTFHDHCSSSHHQASPRPSPPRVPSSVLLGSSTSYAPDPSFVAEAITRKTIDLPDMNQVLVKPQRNYNICIYIIYIYTYH